LNFVMIYSEGKVKVKIYHEIFNTLNIHNSYGSAGEGNKSAYIELG
jgi:hypothetical protein